MFLAFSASCSYKKVPIRKECTWDTVFIRLNAAPTMRRLFELYKICEKASATSIYQWRSQLVRLQARAFKLF